jgi:hypothetical protein
MQMLKFVRIDPKVKCVGKFQPQKDQQQEDDQKAIPWGNAVLDVGLIDTGLDHIANGHEKSGQDKDGKPQSRLMPIGGDYVANPQ